MTTYNAIKALINGKALALETAKSVIFDAYYNNRIDGEEYEELWALMERKYN